MQVTTEQPRPSGAAAGTFIRKGFWAVLDQGLFSIANYMVVSLLLARWLSQRDYGAFVTAFSAFLLLGVIHTALLTEPLLVFAPGRYRENLQKYLGTLLRGHIVVSGLGSLLLALCALVFLFMKQNVLAWAFFCFALTGHFTLFLWLMRRACYARMNPRRAAFAGIGYLVLMVAGLVAMHMLNAISIGSALAVMAVSSLIVGLCLALTGDTLHFRGITGALIRDVIVEHWHYTKWCLPTALLIYVPGNFFYFLLPAMANLEQCAALKAMSNPFLPVGQANTALCLLLLPVFVRARGTHDSKKIHRMSLLVLAGGPIIYWLLIGVFNHPIIHLMYDDKYDKYSYLVWILGLQQVISAFCGVYSSLLRAHQKLAAVFWAGVVSAVSAVVLGVIMFRLWGLTGVCWSVVISYGLHHLTLWLFSREVHSNEAAIKPLSSLEVAADHKSQGPALGEPAAA